MLPDLRIVIAAVTSTFVFAAGVGFYTSSLFIDKPKKPTEPSATAEASPIDRIALSWPEPTPQPEPLALDFAVTARALRNPVRDVTNEPIAANPRSQEAGEAPVRTSATRTDAADAASERPAISPSVIEQTAKVEPAPVALPEPVADPVPVPGAASNESKPAADRPAPVPEPDFRIAVQYPPLAELPPELRAPAMMAPVLPAEAPSQPADIATGSIPATDQPGEPATRSDESAAKPSGEAPQPQVASRPEAEEAQEEALPRTVQLPELPKPAPKAARNAGPKKKAAPARAAKRPARATRRSFRAPARPRATANFPFNFFGTNLQN
ncbi:hypothetical protein [Pseudorhodoplanes sp.]|uniref:hypothetical protein n=1 Tax=Pseudorhodoplanes sp. TaxID=1934341 RepID=UPI003D0D63E7